VDIYDSSITETSYYTIYTWKMKYRLYAIDVIDYTALEIEVNEIRYKQG